MIELPAPEVDLAQSRSRRHARLQQALRRVVDAREHHVADEREDDGVGVQRAQAAEGQPRQPEVRLPERQLRGDDHAHEQRHDAPDHRGDGEGADDRVVVDDRLSCVFVVSMGSTFLLCSSGSGAGRWRGKRAAARRRRRRGRARPIRPRPRSRRPCLAAAASDSRSPWSKSPSRRREKKKMSPAITRTRLKKTRTITRPRRCLPDIRTASTSRQRPSWPA